MLVQYLNTEQIQDVLLNMLLVLDRIFDEHGIRYSLDGGTLLGAVRHKGFIPWDDDVDIIVPRPDFNRLTAHPEWAPDGFSFGIPGADGYLLPFVKFFNLDWQSAEPRITGQMDEFLWIDVFPADSIPVSNKARAQLMSGQQQIETQAERAFISVDYAVDQQHSWWRKFRARILFSVYRIFFPASRSFQKLSDRAQIIPYGLTPYAGDMVWGPYKPDKPGFPISDFDNLVDLDFEGHKFKACPHWDDYLRGLYGDYMTLPPVGDRVTHGTKVWRADTTGATTKNGK